MGSEEWVSSDAEAGGLRLAEGCSGVRDRERSSQGGTLLAPRIEGVLAPLGKPGEGGSGRSSVIPVEG